MLPIHKKVYLSMLVTLFGMSSLFASDLTVSVVDAYQQPVQNAVIELYNENYLNNDKTNTSAAQYEVAQRMRQFTPFVLVVPVGSSVTFPNYDKTRHHVYSFSPVKTFELKLFSGQSHEPVVFDEPGVVALGCNIHDAMQSHIYVTNSRYYGITDANGEVNFTELPDDTFDLKTWHPLQEDALQATEITFNKSVKTIDIVLPIIETFDEDESESEYSY